MVTILNNYTLNLNDCAQERGFGWLPLLHRRCDGTRPLFIGNVHARIGKFIGSLAFVVRHAPPIQNSNLIVPARAVLLFIYVSARGVPSVGALWTRIKWIKMARHSLLPATPGCSVTHDCRKKRLTENAWPFANLLFSRIRFYTGWLFIIILRARE